MVDRKTRIDRILALILACIMVPVVPGMAFAQGTPKVVEVAITGNVNINTETIRNAINLKPDMEYSEQVVEKDRAAIMSLGYFSAVTVRKEDVSGGIKVTYEVTENSRVTEIKIVGSDPIPASKILSLMKTKAGQVLNSTTLNQDIEAIQSYYGEQSYIAYVTEDVGVQAQTGVLTIPILVSRVESIEISGNKKTKSYVFLREMKTKPGQVFNVKTLKEDIIKIYNLDILEDIKPYQLAPGADTGMLKITIPVVEKKTGQMSLGFGYSSNQRLVGQARFAETNFRGKAQGLNLLWQQGTSDQAVGGNASEEISFYEPWIDSKHTSLSVSAFSKIIYRFTGGLFTSSSVADDQDYNERHKGGNATLSRPLNSKYTVFLGGRFENVVTDKNLLTSDVASFAMQGDVLSSSLRLVRNTRDFDLDPAVGGYDSISTEVGTVDGNTFEPYTVGDQTTFVELPFKGGFMKNQIDIRRYFSFKGRKTSPQDKRVTWAFRIRGGIASGSIPYFEQFFAGGAESIRGYREDRFWGDNMFVTSLEFRKPIAQSITGVVFMDYGDAWNGNPAYVIEGFSQSQTFEGHLGYGIGMRVTTPIGHIRLDYGIGDEGSRTHFSMGQAF